MLNAGRVRPLSWCVRVWRVSLPVGVVLALFSAARDYAVSRGSPEPLPFWYWAVGHQISFMLWALIAPLVLLMMIRFPIGRGSWLKNSLIHTVVYTVLAALYAGNVWITDELIAPAITQDLKMPFLHLISVALPSAIMKYYVPIIAAGYIAVYYSRLREQELQTLKLSSQLDQMRLKALKMQLQPHFLFNTLHSISTLVYTDARRADQMIVQLSDLLRMTLDEASTDMVPLRREIESARKYLAIEQTRFSDRLTVEVLVHPDTLDVAVPYLLLQPLIENSVKHGISRKLEDGWISLSARLDGGRLLLTVRDNGPGFDAESAERGQGLGLQNVRKRLEQIYQTDFQLSISRAEGGCVDISLPRDVRQLEKTAWLALDDAARTRAGVTL